MIGKLNLEVKQRRKEKMLLYDERMETLKNIACIGRVRSTMSGTQKS